MISSVVCSLQTRMALQTGAVGALGLRSQYAGLKKNLTAPSPSLLGVSCSIRHRQAQVAHSLAPRPENLPHSTPSNPSTTTEAARFTGASWMVLRSADASLQPQIQSREDYEERRRKDMERIDRRIILATILAFLTLVAMVCWQIFAS